MVQLQMWSNFVESLPVRPLFVTVSGAHLYGFESPDSDIDLRGCHQLPLCDLVGLKCAEPTFEKDGVHEGTEIDIVSHDVGKYFNLLVKNNGYVLEQIFSPLVVCGQSFLDRLRPIARKCVTKHHYHHYRGFYATQRRLIEKQAEKRAKPILYAYRVLLTGIHLLRTGNVEANLIRLNEEFRLPQISDLVASKTEEKIAPPDLNWEFHATELDRLERRLSEAFEASTISETRDRDAVNDLLINLRLGSEALSCN